MGFFDTYVEVGGNWIGADEKATLIDNGIPFQVVALVEDEGNKYGARWVASVLVPDPESGEEAERSLSFPIGTVDSRDRMLSQMAEYLASSDHEPVFVKLEKAGRAILIRQA